MIRMTLALALLALGACHRAPSEAPTLDAAADARARTAAKTEADIAAADQASTAPLPHATSAPIAVRARPDATDLPSDGTVDEPANDAETP